MPFAGWEMPVQFEGIKAEHQAVRESVGLFDVSHMGEIWIEGKDALAFADSLITNDLYSTADGQILYSPMCLENGGIVDDLLAYRYNKEKILFVVNASNRSKDFDHIKKNISGDVTVTDKSDHTGQLAVQGPLSRALMSSISDSVISNLPEFHFVEGSVAGINCLVSRTGYTGEDGYEIYCADKDLPALFLEIEKAGKNHNMKFIGLGARDTLRLEAKLTLYGNDIDETTSPLEAGLGWTVKFTDRDFIGKSALEEQKKQGITRRLVGFEMTDKAIARHGYPIIRGNSIDETPIGTICSGSPSPTLGKNIGLAYLPIDMTKTDTNFNVIIRGIAKGAKVVKTPFYRQKP